MTGSTYYYNPFSNATATGNHSIAFGSQSFASGTTSSWGESDKDKLERERKEKRILREKKLQRIFNGKEFINITTTTTIW
jgi:hypothetical protein